MKLSSIGWTDYSGGALNFIRGCTPASEGCAHCYARAVFAESLLAAWRDSAKETSAAWDRAKEVWGTWDRAWLDIARPWEWAAAQQSDESDEAEDGGLFV